MPIAAGDADPPSRKVLAMYTIACARALQAAYGPVLSGFWLRRILVRLRQGGLCPEVWTDSAVGKHYRVSTLGKVVHITQRSIALVRPQTQGKQRCMALRNCTVKRMSLSRLILLSFVPHDSSSKVVALHLDTNMANSCLYNLRWGKRSTLARQRLACGLVAAEHSAKAVAHHKENAQVGLYPCIESAANSLNIHRNAVARYVAAG